MGGQLKHTKSEDLDPEDVQDDTYRRALEKFDRSKRKKLQEGIVTPEGKPSVYTEDSKNIHVKSLNEKEQVTVISEMLRFGQAMKELRKIRGFTQRYVAEKAGVTDSHVSRVEAGTTNPSLELVIKISIVLGSRVRPVNL